MAIYRNVQMTFWTDSKIVDNYTPEDRYFYLYLLTNPHTNLCGCYEISLKQMSDETGYTKEVVEKLLERMEHTHDVIRYSKNTKELLILNWSKFNWTNSKDFQKPLLKEIQNVKEEGFKHFLVEVIDRPMTVQRPSYDRPKTTDTVYINNTYTESINSNTDINNKLQTIVEKVNRFVPPTVEEVEAYCRERNNDIDAEAFVAFYESKGWMIGKNKMKNWKMAVVTWEKHQPEYGSKRISKEDREINERQNANYGSHWTDHFFDAEQV